MITEMLSSFKIPIRDQFSLSQARHFICGKLAAFFRTIKGGFSSGRDSEWPRNIDEGHYQFFPDYLHDPFAFRVS
jgi:hypothetical protein